MNKKIWSAIFLTLIIMLCPDVSISKAEAPAPGSSSDPVITKSYFDQNTLSEAKVKEMIASAIKNNTPGDQLPSNGGAGNGGSSNPTQPNLIVVQLKSGQTLYAGSGTEFIVRSGKALAVSSDENGIPDLTAGKDIAPGTEIATNHLLIFPRDGRGIKPAPKNASEIYVMIRGSYILLNEDGSTVAP